MKPLQFRRSVACVALLLTALVVTAASPNLRIVLPRGGERGREVAAVFHGARLGDALEVLFYEPGISVLSLDATNSAQLKVRLKLAADARLGQHVVRVRTATGLTEAQTFSVGQYPVVDEKEPNNEFDAPQKIELNRTVHGVANNEDIDYYLVEAKKGQRITAEVEAMRLGSALVDCYVAILDRKRFELSAADDTALGLQDPYASIVAPEDGAYVIAVRESSYAGNGNSHYCLHVGEAPRPAVVYPAGGRAGEELDVKFLGDVRGEISARLRLPADPAGDHDHYLVHEGWSAPSPNKLRVTAFGNVLEQEPNNSAGEAPKTAAELPQAFNGIIGQAEDIDYFRFKAGKGQRFDVRCVARGIRSPLDSVLTLHRADGGQIAANDDSGGPDSYIDWTVPADGEYLVAVRDHLRKGGPHYVYRVEFAPKTSDLTLGIPSFARNSQERNAVYVPRGNRFATLLQVKRSNFGGDVAVGSADLPKGVTMACDQIAGNVNDLPVVFEAAPDAALGAALVSLTGRHVERSEIRGAFSQTLELIYGEPNNTVYYKSTVDRMALAVTEAAPFAIEVIQPKVPLVRSGSMNVAVKATRNEGFKAPIKLRMLWNPPGVGSQNEVTLGEGQTAATYTLNANGGAAIRTWKLAILASSDAGQGTLWTSSQLFDVTIAEPFVAMEIPLSAGEQGADIEVLCKLRQLQPFDGEATVHLHGLPPKVALAANPLSITKTNEQVVFTANVATNAPVGQHKSLFCQVVITRDGEPVIHNIGGGGILRIDAPPPPKPQPSAAPKAVAEVKPAAPPEASKPVPAKPLSRLEQLRLQSRQRAGGQ